MPRSRIGVRRLLGAVAVTVAAVAPLPALAPSGGAAVADAAVAQSWIESDDFEGNDTFANWRFEHAGPGTGGFTGIDTRSPTRAAFISINNSAGFSSVSRSMFIAPDAAGAGATCFFYASVNPGPGAHTVNIEVINPVTYEYVALKTVQVNPNDWYRQHSAVWNTTNLNSPSTVLLRVSILSSTAPVASARVDDVFVMCLL